MIFLRQLKQVIHLAKIAKYMNGQNCRYFPPSAFVKTYAILYGGVFPQKILQETDVYLPSSFINVDQNRICTSIFNCVCRSDKCDVRQNDEIPGLDVRQEKIHMKRR